MHVTTDTLPVTGAGLPSANTHAYCWVLVGRVQGVGLRPFVHGLAHRLGVCGYVQNRSGQVVIVGEGDMSALRRFADALIAEAPPLAQPRILSCSRQNVTGREGFTILPSDAKTKADVHLPPDLFCCDDCLRELRDVRDRRYRYPFINCTQCGPRYTLISRLPYDRVNTSMAGFVLCEQCRTEYQDPGNRRFHAEPVACPNCGPQLEFHIPRRMRLEDTAWGLEECVRQLAAGNIAAVKGVGGYHLMADATNDLAVTRLRERKRRPHKPVALMFPFDDKQHWLQRCVELDEVAHTALFDPSRPIVLSRMRQGAGLAPGISPGLGEIGVMLPYSPMHHLLLDIFGKPLVATSANLSGEPVLTEPEEVEQRLASVADCFLHHNRKILRPADDSVMRVIVGKARPVRCGRGMAPLEIGLPFVLDRPWLAVGSQMKNTIALGWRDRAVVSPHIGDLDSPRALAVFEHVIDDLQALYGVRAERIVCDAHPGFGSTRWAARTGLPLTRILHHHAHASALAGEFPEVAAWLMFTWDGIGLGSDGALWGGEGFLGRPGDWRRIATLRPFRLPGADKAALAPWRSAAGVCWETGHAWRGDRYDALHHAWRRHLNCPRTSAAGRLFDAAAALTGLLDEASYEGQGPMWLEAAAGGMSGKPVALLNARNADGLWQLDWEPLLSLLDDATLPVATRAACFHSSLAWGILAQARAVRAENGVTHVGLCGGVFQNRLLAEQACLLLQRDGFEVHLPERLPCNDGALAFGQLIEVGERR